MMKKVILALVLLLSSAGFCEERQTCYFRDCDMLFAGTVEEIGPLLSGHVTYRLVRFKVERVFKGDISVPYMLIDYPVLHGEETEKVRIGEKICVSASKCKNPRVIVYIDGLRNEGDPVDMLYVGGPINRDVENCQCAQKKQK